MTSDRNWRFPRLGHELAIVGLGFLAVAAAVGAAAGVVLEVVIHRHRAR